MFVFKISKFGALLVQYFESLVAKEILTRVTIMGSY